MVMDLLTVSKLESFQLEIMKKEEDPLGQRCGTYCTLLFIVHMFCVSHDTKTSYTLSDYLYEVLPQISESEVKRNDQPNTKKNKHSIEVVLHELESVHKQARSQFCHHDTSFRCIDCKKSKGDVAICNKEIVTCYTITKI